MPAEWPDPKWNAAGTVPKQEIHKHNSPGIPARSVCLTTYDEILDTLSRSETQHPMISRKLILKLAALAFGLATLQALAAPPPPPALCRPFAVFCSTGTSGGHCGYLPGENCNTCYGIDGSTKVGCNQF
jgi:hypothetical protein